MIYIEAPTKFDNMSGMPEVFLAGGITNCPDWQQEVREKLGKMDLPEFAVFNPRRENFPIHDPKAAEQQITWEFHMLNRAHIFSMWYANADSDQPICMYELGRHLERFAQGKIRYACIGVEPGYRRAQDVAIQTHLVLEEHKRRDYLTQTCSLEDHILAIADAVRKCSKAS